MTDAYNILVKISEKNPPTPEEIRDLKWIFTNEELIFLYSLSLSQLKIIFKDFTSCIDTYNSKTTSEQSPDYYNNWRYQDLHAELLLQRTQSYNEKMGLIRVNSVTDSVDFNKLVTNMKIIENKINEGLNKIKYSIKCKHSIISNNIVFSIIDINNNQIKHLTFHNNGSSDLRGSTHFRKEYTFENRFSGNWWYNNRLTFNNIFKLEYDLKDEVENNIINILNANLKLIIKDEILKEIKLKEMAHISHKRKLSPSGDDERDSESLQYKYLKYKNKYLQLKKIYNAIR